MNHNKKLEPLTLRGFRIHGRHRVMVKKLAQKKSLSESGVVRQAIEEKFRREA